MNLKENIKEHIEEHLKELSAEKKILKAAIKAFIKNGFDGTRTQDIANDAGVNKALLHYYFKTKEQLFQAVFEDTMSDFVEKMLAIKDSDNEIRVKIEAIIDNYFDFYTNNTEKVLFVLNEMNKNPERFVKTIQNTQNFAGMQQFSSFLQKEMLIGTIKTMHPIHFIINIISLCAYTPLAAPMIKMISGLSDADFEKFLTQRRQVIKKIIMENTFEL